MEKQYETKGTHLIVDLWGIDPQVLNNLTYLSKVFKEAIHKCGATIVGYTEKQFEPYGVSFVYLLSESHLSAHSYCLEGYLSCDFYVCGSVNPNEAMDYIIEQIQPDPNRVYRQHLIRGVE